MVEPSVHTFLSPIWPVCVFARLLYDLEDKLKCSGRYTTLKTGGDMLAQYFHHQSLGYMFSQYSRAHHRTQTALVAKCRSFFHWDGNWKLMQ